MPTLKYEGRQVYSREGESVLDAFQRQGITIPFSCRNGIFVLRDGAPETAGVLGLRRDKRKD